MHELKQVAGKTGKRASAFATLLVVALAAAGGIALAQAQRAGGPTPSGQGAEVYFIDLKDGATVPAKLKLFFGLRNMGVAPAGSDRENSGHHHLLIDTELPPLDKPIPNDFNHLHFGAGQTEAEITLQTRAAHIAAAHGRQGPRSAHAAGDVAAHSRPGRGRCARCGRRADRRAFAVTCRGRGLLH